jgi:hypothetical protein
MDSGFRHERFPAKCAGDMKEIGYDELIFFHFSLIANFVFFGVIGSLANPEP